LQREVREETGLEVSVDSIATVFERIMPDSSGACEYHYVLVDFFCSVLAGVLQAGTDSSRAQWFNLDTLSDLKLTAGTLDVIQLCRSLSGAHPVVTRP